MSATIDERVVEMRFDNQQFEQQAKASLETLARLRESLNMETATKSLDDLSRASSRFNLDGIGNAVETVNAKFSALEVVAFTTLQRITNKAIDTGEKLVKSLSLDQIEAGYQKYETKTAAIQTIMAATGKSIEEVTSYVEKLNWYTDETSYNLVDMINNIGKFTSNGVALEDATNAMMGIGNAAALAGANAQKASHAMLGFSKAMAKGYLQRQNWMWIQTAGMDTKEFKEQIIDTALELGTLTKAADGTVTTLEGGVVAFDDFETELKSGWATSEVVINALNRYSGELNDIYERVQETGETTSSVLAEMGDSMDALWLKSFKAAQEAKTFTEAIDAVKDAVSTGWMQTFELIFGNYEEAKTLWTDLANVLWEVFAAGGAARNEMLKIWKNLHGNEYLIGGLEKAFANIVGLLDVVKEGFEEVFPPMTGERLKDLCVQFDRLMAALTPTEFTLWRVKKAVSGVASVFKVGIRVVKSIAAGLKPLFDVLMAVADIMLSLSAYAGEWLSSLEDSLDELGVFAGITRTVNTVLYIFVGAIALAVTAINNLINAVKNAFHIREMSKNLGEMTEESQKVHPILSALITAFEVLNGIAHIVAAGFAALAGAAVYLITNISKIPAFFKTIYDHLTFLHPVVDLITNAFGKFVEATRNYPEFLASLSSKFEEVKAKLAVFFSTLKDNFKNVHSIKDAFKAVFDTIQKFIQSSPKLSATLEGLQKKLAEFKTAIVKFAQDLRSQVGEDYLGKVMAVLFGVTLINAILTLSKLMNNVANLSGTLNTTFITINKLGNSIFNSLKPSMLIQVATSLTMLAGSLYLVAQIPTPDLLRAGAAIAVLGGILAGLSVLTSFLPKISKITDVAGFQNLAILMVSLSGSMVLLAGAVRLLEGVKLDNDLGVRLLALAGVMVELVVASIALSKFAGPMTVSALGLLAFSFSIMQIVKALMALDGLDTTKIQQNLDTLGTMIVAISVLALSAGRVKFTSAAAVLLMIGSIYLIEMALKNVIDNGVSLDEIRAHLDKFGSVILSLLVIVGFVAMVGNSKASLGAAATIAAFALSLYSILNAMDRLKDFSPEEALTAVLSMAGLMVGMGIMMALTEVAGAHAHKAALAVVAVGIAMSLAGGVVKSLLDPELSYDHLWQALAVVTTLGVLFAGVIMATQFAAQAKVGPILAAILGLGVVVAALAVLYNFTDTLRLIGEAFAIAIAMVGLAGAIFLMSKASEGISLKSIVGFIGVIAALAAATGAIALLANVGENVDKVPAIGLTLAALMIAMGTAAHFADASIQSALALAIMSIPLMIAAAAIKTLADSGVNWDQAIASAAAMALIMVSLAFAANLANTAIVGAAAMVILGVSAIALAAAFMILADVDYTSLESNLIAAGIALGALMGIALVANALFVPLAVGLTVLAAALAVIVLAANGFATAASTIAIAIKMVADAFDQAGQNAPQNAENISNAIIKIFTSIGKGAGDMVNTFAKTLTEGIGKAFDNLIKVISAKVKPILNVLGTLAQGVSIVMSEGLSGLPKVAELAFGEFMGTAETSLSGVDELGVNAAEGFTLGVESGKKSIIDIAKDVADWFVNDGLAVGLDSHSPSERTADQGVNADLGFIGGVQSLLGAVADSGRNVANTFLGSLGSRLQSGLAEMAANNPAMAELFNTLYDGGLSQIDTSIEAINERNHDKYLQRAIKNAKDQAAKSDQENLKKMMNLDALGGGGSKGGGGGGGGASGAIEETTDALTELTEAIRNQMDIFSRYDAQFNIMGQSVLQNMKSQIDGTRNWANSIKLLAKSGISDGLLAQLRDMGPQGAAHVQAFLMMSREQLMEANELFTTSLAEPAELAASILDGVASTTETSTTIIKTATEAGAEFVQASTESAEAAEYQVQRIQQAYENMRVSLAGTIASQISMFDKFDDSTEKTAEEVLQNMNSQLNGMNDWANMLTELAERGIDQGLLQHLADMGPQGYDLTHAFVTMTNDQLTEAGELWQSHLTIDTFQANRIVDSWKAVGTNMTDGLIEGVNEPDAEGAIVAVADNMEDAIKTATDQHSPSRVYEEIGENITLGLIRGILGGSGQAYMTMVELADLTYRAYEDRTPMEKYEGLGAKICEGIARGIKNNARIIEQTISSVADDAYKTFASAWDIHSPSRRFAELGMYADEGLANGLAKYSQLVSNSAENIGENAVSSLGNSLMKVSDVLSDEVNLDPTIRPVLDLSSVISGSNQIDALLSNRTMALSGINASFSSETSRLAALLSGMQDVNNQNGVINAIRELKTEFAYMTDAVQRMQIVLDTGVVAGAVTPFVGDRLQHEATMKGMVWT